MADDGKLGILAAARSRAGRRKVTGVGSARCSAAAAVRAAAWMRGMPAAEGAVAVAEMAKGEERVE